MDAEDFARSWLAAFNARDVNAIMAHYADDIEHSSPTVVRVLGEPSGIVRGKAALREYFEKALAAASVELSADSSPTRRGSGDAPASVELSADSSPTRRGSGDAPATSDLHYEPLTLHVGVRGLTLVYHRTGGKLVAETFHFDTGGLVVRAFVAHADAPPAR